jgi:hypothetical protein
MNDLSKAILKDDQLARVLWRYLADTMGYTIGRAKLVKNTDDNQDIETTPMTEEDFLDALSHVTNSFIEDFKEETLDNKTN